MDEILERVFLERLTVGQLLEVDQQEFYFHSGSLQTFQLDQLFIPFFVVFLYSYLFEVVFDVLIWWWLFFAAFATHFLSNLFFIIFLIQIQIYTTFNLILSYIINYLFANSIYIINTFYIKLFHNKYVKVEYTL